MVGDGLWCLGQVRLLGTEMPEGWTGGQILSKWGGVLAHPPLQAAKALRLVTLTALRGLVESPSLGAEAQGACPHQTTTGSVRHHQTIQSAPRRPASVVTFQKMKKCLLPAWEGSTADFLSELVLQCAGDAKLEKVFLCSSA